MIVLPSHDMIYLRLQWFERRISKKKNASKQCMSDKECIVEKAVTLNQLLMIAGARKDKLWSIELLDLNNANVNVGQTSIAFRKIGTPLASLHTSKRLEIIITTSA